MTKQEMAEWLAEKVLGCKDYGDRHKIMGRFWCGRDEFASKSKYESLVTEFIYSPDGFFAVINEIPEDKFSNNLMEAWQYFLHDMDMDAFYNAVYEAMEE